MVAAPAGPDKRPRSTHRSGLGVMGHHVIRRLTYGYSRLAPAGARRRFHLTLALWASANGVVGCAWSPLRN